MASIPKAARFCGLGMSAGGAGVYRLVVKLVRALGGCLGIRRR